MNGSTDNDHSAKPKKWPAIAIGLMVVMIDMISIHGGPSWSADTTGTTSTVTFKSGQVTAKHGTIVEIGGVAYSMDAEATIKDDEERPRTLNDVKVGAEVKFHLKRDKIDQLILLLPK